MAIASKLREYLESRQIDYELLPHPYTPSAMRTAEAAHVSGETLIKSVMLCDEQGFLMVVLPATHRVDLGVLHRTLHRNLGLATERDLGALIEDCDLGAVPPIGPAYGIETLVDSCLEDTTDIYFEAGDHQELIHLRGDQFGRLMEGAKRMRLSHHV